MTDQFTLYHYWRSSCSWRLRWAFLHKGLSYKSVTVNLLTGEHLQPKYRAINPTASVPAVQWRGQVFTESLAIMEWLDETFSQNPLFPGSPADRFKVRQIAQMIVSGIQPLQNLKVLKYYATQQDERSRIAKHWNEEGLRNVEELLVRERLSGTYTFGESVTAADLCVVPQVYNACRFNVDMQQFPTLDRIYKKCMQLRHCQAAAPEQQPDAVK